MQLVLIIISYFFKVAMSNIISLSIANEHLLLLFNKNDTDKARIYFSIDFYMTFSVFIKDKYYEHQVNLSNQTQLVYSREGKENCTLFTTSLYEHKKEFEINNITLCYRNNSEIRFFFSRVSFAFAVKEESSLVHQAYNQGLISHRSFSMEVDSWDYGYLHLGGIPNKYNNKKWGYCVVYIWSEKWGCMLKSITFLDYEYVVNQYAFFDYYRNKVHLPKKFREDFIKIAKMKDKEILKEYNKVIKYKIGNYIYSIEQIGKDIEDKFYFEIEWNEKQQIILGKPFFSSFVIHFDYESKIISLFNKGSFERIEELLIKKKINFKFIGIFINFLILFIGVIFQLTIKNFNFS